MTTKPTVLVSTSSFGVHDRAPLDTLEAAGFDVRLNPHGRKLSEEEAATLYAGCVGVVAGTERISAHVLDGAPGLRAISRVGVGTDAIDFEAAKKANVAVTNTPSAHVDAVAELVLGGILASYRHLPKADAIVRSGEWKKPMGRLFRGKSLGLVGFGQVAQRLCELVRPFEVRVFASDLVPNESRASELGVELSSLESVLRQSDVVSLHVPATTSTKGLIGAAQLSLMKADALLVNAARGGIVDEDALLRHLEQQPEFTAYLDTFATEPYAGPLAQHERVMLSSHIGSYAVEARVRMEQEAADNLVRLLQESGGRE